MIQEPPQIYDLDENIDGKESLRGQVRALLKRHGLTPDSLLEGRDDIPPGFGSSVITAWFDGSAKTALRDHIAYFFKVITERALYGISPKSTSPIPAEEVVEKNNIDLINRFKRLARQKKTNFIDLVKTNDTAAHKALLYKGRRILDGDLKNINGSEIIQLLNLLREHEPRVRLDENHRLEKLHKLLAKARATPNYHESRIFEPGLRKIVTQWEAGNIKTTSRIQLATAIKNLRNYKSSRVRLDENHRLERLEKLIAIARAKDPGYRSPLSPEQETACKNWRYGHVMTAERKLLAAVFKAYRNYTPLKVRMDQNHRSEKLIHLLKKARGANGFAKGDNPFSKKMQDTIYGWENGLAMFANRDELAKVMKTLRNYKPSKADLNQNHRQERLIYLLNIVSSNLLSVLKANDVPDAKKLRDRIYTWKNGSTRSADRKEFATVIKILRNYAMTQNTLSNSVNMALEKPDVTLA